MWSFVVFSVLLIIANGEKSRSQKGHVNMSIYLDRGNPVDMNIGQVDGQVYCKIVAPNKHTVLDGFGRCRLKLDRVGFEHEGLWKVYIGYSGRVNLVEETVYVTLVEPVSATDVVKPIVDELSPGVKMTCLIMTGHNVRGCQFRGPRGQVLLASGSYDETFNGTRYKTELGGTDCSVTIVDPKEAHLGRWRCAVEAEDDTYYAFMEVFVHNEGYNIDMNPTINPQKAEVVSGLENEPVILMCSGDAEIRYCDFRDSNGTTISVFPGMKSSSVEYVGSGFNAGECGVKMILPVSKNEQVWSCNIGLVENTKEYNAFFRIHIQEYLQVAQYERRYGSVTVSASTHNGDSPYYCRFVRFDGLMFTTEDTSPRSHNGSISGGTCEITTHNPTYLDRQPWTVFAKIPGVNGEVAKLSSGLIFEATEYATDINNSRRPVFLFLILSVIMISLTATIALAPKKNRQWVASRAVRVRQSLRGKKPLIENEPTLPTPVTAASAERIPYAQYA